MQMMGSLRTNVLFPKYIPSVNTNKVQKCNLHTYTIHYSISLSNPPNAHLRPPRDKQTAKTKIQSTTTLKRNATLSPLCMLNQKQNSVGDK